MQATILDMADFKDINDTLEEQKAHLSLNFSVGQLDSGNTALQLANVLQSTLELSKLLELFDDELSALVSYDGMSYVNKEKRHSVTFGVEAPNRVSCRLVLIENDLGELGLFRNTKFDDDEIRILENTITALVYPLRNAILYQQALEKAYRDPLTGVNNRAALDKALAQEISLSKRHATPLSIIMLDVDNFKGINDNYGHITGDAVLKRIAESMVECARDSDIIYRYGGEEFLLLLRNTDEAGALLVAERMRQAIENILFRYDAFDIRVTASQGLSSLMTEDDLNSMLGRCDKALYSAKNEGRNRIIVG